MINKKNLIRILVLLTFILILSSISLGNVAKPYDNKKVKLGKSFNATWNGPGDGPSEDVELIYNYSKFTDHIYNESNVYVCKYFNNYDRWVPMRDAVKELNNNVVRFYTNKMPQKFSLCLINDKADCNYRPNASTFEEVSPDFNSVNVTKLDNLSKVVLKKNLAKINWSKEKYDVCGEPLDQATSFSGEHVSLDTDVLDRTLDSEAKVVLEDVDCSDFEIYYSSDFYNNSAEIVSQGKKVADEMNVGGDCINSSLCTNVECSVSTLTFNAKHFDSFSSSSTSGDDTNTIPEFNTFGLILIIAIAGIGFYFISKRKK